jgi:hypothetical protein
VTGITRVTLHLHEENIKCAYEATEFFSAFFSPYQSHTLLAECDGLKEAEVDFNSNSI